MELSFEIVVKSFLFMLGAGLVIGILTVILLALMDKLIMTIYKKIKRG